MPVDDGRRRRVEGKAELVEPVDGVRRLVDREADEPGVGLTLADPHHVLVVEIGRVLDATLALATRAGGAHVPAAHVQRPAHAVRRLDDRDVRAARRGLDRAREPSGARSEDDAVERLAQLSTSRSRSRQG